jgi:protoporphyrinogen oxidase
MKIGILGGGISGLSIGRLLNENHTIEILEQQKEIGGIAKTVDVEGVPYHITGGHCFNSKYPDVLDFVFNRILPEESWHYINRNAKIQFKGKLISYPIEFSIRQIFEFQSDLALDIVKDFIGTKEEITEFENLEEWFIGKFGNTLAQEYFIPYNTKIWNKSLKDISYEWVEDKLPKPDKNKFIKSLFCKETDSMSHHSFYYPKNNQNNPFIKALGENLNVSLNYKINSIEKINNKFIVNNEKEYDLIISTLPLNMITQLITGSPKLVHDAANNLRYNKLSTMIWESEIDESTWTYIPDKDSIFHREINISNFFKGKKGFTITEAIGEHTFDEMQKNGLKNKHLIRPLSHHISDHAYVVFDKNCSENKDIIKSYLKEIGLITHGRFGEWDYFNMDICIKKSLDLADFIKHNY